ncbi:hypothetical protein N7492_010467 [Penicillium capsulatum]|uniref:Uncharacterized protein n=1 Tax=Penicillium capsulatum TaxID=69766 RepID=A0A9W9HP75_9EURO|nr:hypothetical protein N7492_010467 [Penicillium capsulatum]KAJ6112970.1 hypothetical protein N7512_008294 [Penicillium capsulatum]
MSHSGVSGDLGDLTGSNESPEGRHDQSQESPEGQYQANDFFVTADSMGLGPMQAVADYTYDNRINTISYGQTLFSSDQNDESSTFIEDASDVVPRQDDGDPPTEANVNCSDSDSDWPDDADPEQEAKFAAASSYFHALRNPSQEDFVEFRKAQRDEYCRQKMLEIRRNAKDSKYGKPVLSNTASDLPALSADCSGESEHPQNEDSPVDENRTSGPSNPSIRSAPTSKSACAGQKSILISGKEKKKAMEVGLASLIGVNELTIELYFRGRNIQDVLAESSHDDVKLIFGISDIIATANASTSMPAMHVSKHKDKAKALTELVASIPSKNKGEARSDKKDVQEALKAFTRPPRLAEDNRWKLKGLNTTLMYHQVLAVGWMRKRETSPTYPLGGLLCDTMGFGKTLTSLANIMDGRQTDSPNKPLTLIVVPTSLRAHWAQQIQTHCNRVQFGIPYEYGNHLRFNEDLTLESLRKHDLVLTTYEVVRQSYPCLKPPQGPKYDDAIAKWWIEKYDQEIGLLHKIKWDRIILDGNAVEEFYPYFRFLGVAKSFSEFTFIRQFWDGDEDSKQRLINTLRSIIHRKTHESRLFGSPIIRLPTITQENVMVDFSKAEWLLYRKIADFYVEEINDLAGSGNVMSHSQLSRILAMFLKLRMFSSHLLAAQDLVQYLLRRDDDTLQWLTSLAEGHDSDDVSIQISKLILGMWRAGTIEAQPPEPDEVVTMHPMGDLGMLIKNYRTMMAQASDEQQAARYKCPFCASDPLPAIITSCKHLYCEECYNALPDQYGKTETEKPRVCCSCEVPIEEAAFWSSFDRINQFKGLVQPNSASSRKRRRESKAKKTFQTASASRPFKKAFRGAKPYGMFQSSSNDPNGPEENDYKSNAKDLIPNWIPEIGPTMPAAKITKMRDIIKSWIQQDAKAKIVVFTYFLDTLELIRLMCKREGWVSNKLCGKMSESARNSNVTDFQQNEDTKILVATTKTGGYGIDLSVANKCILMDLWWNEAAYGRLLRLNQTREMECIKLVAAGSYDQRMLDIQKRKAKNIDEFMNLKVLEDRATIKELLGYFGTVKDVRGGGFRIDRPEAFEAEQTS